MSASFIDEKFIPQLLHCIIMAGIYDKFQFLQHCIVLCKIGDNLFHFVEHGCLLRCGILTFIVSLSQFVNDVES